MVLTQLAITGIAVVMYATVLFAVALRSNNNGVADIGYGGLFLVATVATVVQLGSVPNLYSLTLIVCVFVWATRLILRIYHKNLGKPEDFRYKLWRDSWGRWFTLRSYLQIYVLQACIGFAIALPILLSLLMPRDVISVAVFSVGIFLWCVGFYFEARGDYELDRFLAQQEHKGRIMKEGLWRYSRHPNYFGESVLWWGIALASFSASTAGLIVFVSPIIITYLLLYVSGIPMLERKWAGNPEWEAYKVRTSAFIPLPPREHKKELN